MLDDIKYIEQFDRSNALAIIAGQADQLRQQYEVEAPVVHGLQNIVVAGMGGSALAAEFIRSWLSDRLPVPVEIVREYRLPAYVNEHSLIIISSYSGNTEEALAVLEDSKKYRAHVIIMTAGGKLAEIAKKDGYAQIDIPSGLQPRLAVLFGVKAIASVIEHLGLTEDVTGELEAQADWLVDEARIFAASVLTIDNPAKQIAEKLVGHPIVVYGGPMLAMVAMKWKIDFNENGKNQAFYNVLSEFNHNEFIGWQNPRNTTLRVVELQSSLDNDRIKKRFEVSNRLLSGIMPAPVIVEAHGQTKLQQMLWTLLLGDFASAYLAILNGVDPTPVELIEKLKVELS